jgi:penicillin-binding protein 1B
MTSKKIPTKATPTKKPVKKPKTTTAKKAVPKKSVPKKAPAKTTSKNVTPKKTAPKKTASKKPVAKKPSKKSTNKKESLSWKGLFVRLLMVGVVIGGGIFVYVDAIVTQKFDGKRWEIPATVYARPLELYVGANISANELQQELVHLGYEPSWQSGGVGTYQRRQNQFEIHRRGFRFWDAAESDQKIHLTIHQGILSQLQVDGQAADVTRLDPMRIGGLYPKHNEDRQLIQLSQAPELLKKALVAVEDKGFYEHKGISPKGILRALVGNIKAGRTVQGGSTLTQQLVKNFYLSSERTLWRKAVEAVMALSLELHYSKDEILEAYLNEVYLGQAGARGVHGFGLASLHYFAKPLETLELEEIALLVGIIKGPSYYDPRRRPLRATDRRDLVLTLMRQQGIITPIEEKRYHNKPLIVAEQGQYVGREFPAFLDLVKRQLRRDYREADLTGDGLRIFTSLNPIHQDQAEKALSKRLTRLEKKHKLKHRTLEGAVVLTSTQEGEVLAMVGSRRARFLGFNRALDSKRPIGSLVKPALYLTALQQNYHLGSMLDDSPITVANGRGGDWSPQNYDNKSHGQVPLFVALAKSYNQAATRLGMSVGVDSVVGNLNRLGVKQTIPPYPSVLLGSVSLSPLEVTGMYQTIAADGFSTQPKAIRAVTTSQGELITAYGLEVSQRFERNNILKLQSGMQQVFNIGSARWAYSVLDKSLGLAGKTGTTNGQRDSWFAGFGGDKLGVVWIGRDDNGKTPLTGSSGALRVWTDLMAQAKPGELSLIHDENIVATKVSIKSGLDLGDQCNEGVTLLFSINQKLAEEPCPSAPTGWFRSLFK